MGMPHTGTTSRDLGPRTFFASSARLELELASSARLELELASSARLELEAGDVQPTPEQSSRVGRLSVLSENFQRSVALSDAAVAVLCAASSCAMLGMTSSLPPPRARSCIVRDGTESSCYI